jgi:hypothetical protein
MNILENGEVNARRILQLLIDAVEIANQTKEMTVRQKKSDMLIKLAFPTEASFKSNKEIIKRGVIEGFKETQFCKDTDKYVNKRGLYGQSKIDQKRRVIIENKICQHIGRLQKRLYHSTDNDEGNENSIQKKGEQLEKSAQKAVLKFKLFCEKNPAAFTPRKKKRGCRDDYNSELEHSEADTNYDGESDGVEEEEEEEDSDEEDSDEEYVGEFSEVDEDRDGEYKKYFKTLLTKMFEDGDTNQQKLDKINKMFRNQSRKLHPDKFHKDMDDKEKAIKTHKFKLMNLIRGELIDVFS